MLLGLRARIIYKNGSSTVFKQAPGIARPLYGKAYSRHGAHKTAPKGQSASQSKRSNVFGKLFRYLHSTIKNKSVVYL